MPGSAGRAYDLSPSPHPARLNVTIDVPMPSARPGLVRLATHAKTVNLEGGHA